MKNRFLTNLLLTFLWVVLTASFTFADFLFGFLLGYFFLWITSMGGGKTKYFRLMPKLIAFFFFFLYELVKANIQVAYEVGTPKLKMTPGIVAVPLDVKTDFEITTLANLITLTPGTLSLDVSDDNKVLYVHSMYISNREDFIKGIKNGFEKRIMEITQ